MTPEQEIRLAALNAAVAWIGSDDDHCTTDQMLNMAERFEGYIRGPVVTQSASDVDEFYCAGAVSGGTDARRGCSHPRHSHGKYGCEVGTASMNTPLCPCEREDGK